MLYKSSIKRKVKSVKGSETKLYLSSDIIIYNDKIAIISLEKNNLSGVEITNQEMVKTQKSLFDIVWEVAKSL